MYENMGIFDESLIQYDVLDALLTQFVGDIPTGLDEFTKNLDDWTQLSLDKAINMKLLQAGDQKTVLTRHPKLSVL